MSIRRSHVAVVAQRPPTGDAGAALVVADTRAVPGALPRNLAVRGMLIGLLLGAAMWALLALGLLALL